MANSYKTGHKTDNLIINELILRPVDRTRKDILTWRSALVAAESIYFPNRTRLYDLYADIILDGHLSGIISKRIDAVLNKKIHFVQNGNRLQSMNGFTETMPFRELMRTIMETQMWGISAVEFMPGPKLEFALIPRKHIKPEQGIISFDQIGLDGVPFEHLENVWVMGDKHNLGILLKCAPYCLYKRGGLSDWAQFIELFGQPVRIIKYDSYDEQTKVELKKILEESGSSLAMMIPKQTDFEIKDGKQSNGDGNLQLTFIKALNEELSITVLGNTETTTSSYSSGYAQSRVHLQQQYEITASDLIYTAAMLNSPKFRAILLSYGYPVAEGWFEFAKDLDIDYLANRLKIDKDVAQMVDVPESYWRDTYGLPNNG